MFVNADLQKDFSIVLVAAITEKTECTLVLI